MYMYNVSDFSCLKIIMSLLTNYKKIFVFYCIDKYVLLENTLLTKFLC